MLRRWRYRKRCRVLAESCREPVMSHYLEQGSLLRPEKLSDTPMIAVDLELTGLDAASNQIISVGWTHLDQGRIRFGSNRHILVNAEQSVGHSAAIHELTDTEVSTGVKPRDALESLFEAAAGRAWVFHHAGLDVSFLQSACREWFGLKPPFAVLDTMQIELGLRKRREQPVQQGDLQLGRLRSDYGLPRYTAHNALIDALATAELLLAIAARLDKNNDPDLAPFLRYM